MCDTNVGVCALLLLGIYDMYSYACRAYAVVTSHTEHLGLTN